MEGVMKKKWVFNVVLLVCIAVFLACGIYLLHYYMSAKQTESELEELLQLKTESEEDTGDTETLVTDEGKTVLKAYRKLYKKNTDLVGWIAVKGTPIDYPVMQTKKEPEFYLHCNYKKEYDVNGLPFLDAKCDVEDAQSNLMVYGHHMKSGLMFAHLVDYDSVDFYKKHPVIEFDTLYEKREYEIVAAFYSQVYKENQKVFKYYNWPGHLSEKQYSNYVKNIKKLSVYDTGVTPEYGEQLITLVTCAYQTEDGRFVVVAKRKA
jgi:sortase B